MFKTCIALFLIIVLISLCSLILTIMGTFGLSGGIWDWLWSCINWSWLETYQDLAAGSIGALLLASAAIVAISHLRAVRRISYAELLGRLTEQWNSDAFIESRYRLLEIAPQGMDEEVLRKKIAEIMITTQQKNHKDYFILTRTLDFFEELAFLVRKKDIPLEDAHRLFGDSMVEYYKLFEDFVKEQRKLPENPNAYKELEQVVETLTEKYSSITKNN